MHGHGACPLSIVHEKEGEEKNCVGWNLTPNEDQRSKRACLRTRFQKGDPEGRRDHFHFDQKFSSKTQKKKMKMMVGKSDRIKKLGVLNRECTRTRRDPAMPFVIGFASFSGKTLKLTEHIDAQCKMPAIPETQASHCRPLCSWGA